jgi:acyl dehydratase
MASTVYWEDLEAGRVYELGTTSVSAEQIKEFAAQYDPQPFHLDEEAGRRSLFGGLCASGWQTCALVMRLTYDQMLKNSSSLGSPGLENLKWLKPVYPDDQLALRYTILETRPLRKHPGTGIVLGHWELFNQRGDKVFEMTGHGFFGRRHPATAAELAHMDAQRAA